MDTISRNIEDREVFELESADDIHLIGKIDGNARVTLASGGSIKIDGKVDNRSVVSLSAHKDIFVGAVGDAGDRKIDSGSQVTCVAKTGQIIIGGKIDSGSIVHLTADQLVAIGAVGDAGDRKIDGSSQVTCVSKSGPIVIGGKIGGNSIVDLTASGDIELFMRGNRDPHAGVHDNSRLMCVSTSGSIRMNGIALSDSEARLTAALDVLIDSHSEQLQQGRIGALIVARAGRHIRMSGSLISKAADFYACQGIAISGSIATSYSSSPVTTHIPYAASPVTVRLATAGEPIRVIGPIGGRAMRVEFWPNDSLIAEGGISEATVVANNWVGSDGWCSKGQSEGSHWWQNWPWTFGYVTKRAYPRSLAELTEQVSNPGEGIEAIKAVGGGWSFTDASLPCQTREEIERISILRLGASGRWNTQGILEGMNDPYRPKDLWPENVARQKAIHTHYDQVSTEQKLTSGPYLPSVTGVKIIDTRGMASSLQSQLASILSETAKSRMTEGQFYFHVEAGITIAELNILLDHQSPRLALQSSGGSPGATLAGTIATATHGGEFRWPLLVDQIRAIHLVGPGGQEWWIEGDESIANLEALQQIYPAIDANHFIGGEWNEMDGLTASDVLSAVVVSMGTMGVVYSVVLEVVPQYGLRQVVKPIKDWTSLLEATGVTVGALRDGSVEANTQVLNFLLDGTRNGTGIELDKNVYVDLAINPINHRCWIFNREVTPELPVDHNELDLSMGTFINRVTRELTKHSRSSTLGWNYFLGRVFDFLRWKTEDIHQLNNFNQAVRLSRYVTSSPDLLVKAVATASVQTVGNTVFSSGEPDRGHQFLGDILTALLDVLSGTTEFEKSDITGVAYKVGAIGWPNNGVPGRAIEVSLPPEQAFSLIQNLLLDDLFEKVMKDQNKPLIGYISIRVCPPTTTLMGMQQFSPYSVMVEIVAYRSPEANEFMDKFQQRILTMIREGKLTAMLHWGLENDQMTASDLQAMPINRLLRPASDYTQLSAFTAIREYIRNDGKQVFDNYFSHRLGL